jgi:hypothetical protein
VFIGYSNRLWSVWLTRFLKPGGASKFMLDCDDTDLSKQQQAAGFPRSTERHRLSMLVFE